MKEEEIDNWKKALTILSKVMLPGISLALLGDPVYAQGATTLTLEILGLAQSEAKLKRVESLLFGTEALLKKHNPNFDFGKTNNQEVRDLLEIAIINASKANSESKIERLRSVLFGHLIDPQPYDYISRYLDLALKLNDSQIRILKYYVDTESNLEPLRKEMAKFIKVKVRAEEAERRVLAPGSRASTQQRKVLKHKQQERDNNLESLQHEFEYILKIRRKRNMEFDEDEFPFLFNDLRVLGLVYNASEGRASDGGDSAGYRCTALAKGFMRYLTGEESLEGQ
ncbi:MAG: hypothetical protein AAFU57_13830 [Bacteroidota bacterium]